MPGSPRRTTKRATPVLTFAHSASRTFDSLARPTKGVLGNHSEQGHRALDAFELTRAEGFRRQRTGEQAPERIREHHLTGGGLALNPSSDIRRFSDRNTLGSAAPFQRAYDDLAAVDTDADLEVDFGGYAHLSHRLEHIDGASNHTRWIIFVSPRIAKIDLDAVTPILRYKAIMAVHDFFASVLVRADHAAHILRVQSVRKRR